MTNYDDPPLEDRVQAALATLAGPADECPDEVANVLEEAGVLAEPGDCEKCALAVWLTTHVSGLCAVSVNPDTAHVYARDVNGNSCDLDMPGVLVEFAELFDAGDYPDLVLPGAELP